MINSMHLLFELWSDSHQLIYECIFLSINFDDTSNIKLSDIKAECCVTTVKLHIDESVNVLSNKILISFTVKHTITSFYIEC